MLAPGRRQMRGFPVRRGRSHRKQHRAPGKGPEKALPQGSEHAGVWPNRLPGSSHWAFLIRERTASRKALRAGDRVARSS